MKPKRVQRHVTNADFYESSRFLIIDATLVPVQALDRKKDSQCESNYPVIFSLNVLLRGSALTLSFLF